MKSNSTIAAETLTEILNVGTRNFVLCAGARNAPLIVPLLKMDGQDGVKIWHHFDERAAAFFALGLAKRRLEPVCVVTTSGTAVAELLSATIEAFYSGIPLILLTADRPERFRGTGAPQAIEQVGMFGNYAVTDFGNWNQESPLHLNVCFEEPLFDEEQVVCEVARRGAELAAIGNVEVGELSAKTVVLVGELLEAERDCVADFLRETSLPTWCEAISGLREAEGINHIRGGEAAFSEMEIEAVLRIGGAPSLRFWRDLETRPEIAVTSISRMGFPGLARACETKQQGWFGEATGCVRSGIPKQQGTFGEQPLLDREELALRDLSERIPSGALVFLGNSLPIREWNLAASTEVSHRHCFANRGANGIDGEISTFLGLCQDFEGDECWGIFGDLTTLYDLSGPWICDQLDAGKRIRIVVVDNGGGKIFSKLPGLKDLGDGEKKVTENWHGFDFEKWAELWPGVDVEVLDMRVEEGRTEAQSTQSQTG